MSWSLKVGAYLALEQGMMTLDDMEDPWAEGLADKLRDDVLDPLWKALTEEEYAELLNAKRLANEK